jgi:hypothetical protein
MPAIPALRRLRQEDQEEASLGYMVRYYFKIKTLKKIFCGTGI